MNAYNLIHLFFFLLIFSSSKFKNLLQRKAYLSRLMTKPTKWHMRPAKTQIRLGIRPVWSESLLNAQWVAKDPSFLHADSEDSDLSLRLAHMPFCWFCHEAAYFMIMQDEPRLTLKMSSPYPIILTLICPFSLSVCLCLSLSQLAHLHDSCSYGNREITF